MRLSVKMILVFSTIILLAIMLLSQYAMEITQTGSDAYSESRIKNMSQTITRDVTREFDMMQLTITELTENTSFMAAVNQYVRDDSDDNKVGLAARNAAVQHLLQSPLVDDYYRVSFFTTDGHYFSSQPDKDSMLTGNTEALKSLIASIDYMSGIDDVQGARVIAPHYDAFSSRGDIYLYGLIQKVEYRGNVLGYLAVYNEVSGLTHLLDYLDNLVEIEIQLQLSNGLVLYTNSQQTIKYTDDLACDTYSRWTDKETGISYDVMRSDISRYQIQFYVARNTSFRENGIMNLRNGILKRAGIIAIPAVILIALLSYLLGRSIHLLTRKVQRMPAEKILDSSSDLTGYVTSARDKETHALETAYNQLMQSLRESVMSELTLREGTLQAQLNALQTQINPHFIYNTLNIISAKSMESGNYDVIELCDQFASMLRYSTDTRSRTATVSQEIENVTDYLKIAKARFENNLEYTISVPDSVSDIKMPKLSLQPLVENAINHGYNGANILRKVSVTGRLEGKNLLLCIHDNGTGFDEGILEALRAKIRDMYASNGTSAEATEHIGLLNTVMRLYYYSNGRVKIDIGNENGAYIVLTIPLDM